MRLSVLLAGALLVGMIVLGTVQTVLDVPENTLAGAAVMEVNTQQKINLCMNSCMNSCVVKLDDTDPCREICEQECGV